MPAVAGTGPRSPSVEDLVAGARSRALRVRAFNSRPLPRRSPRKFKNPAHQTKRQTYSSPATPRISSPAPSDTQHHTIAKSTRLPQPTSDQPHEQLLPLARQAKRAPKKGSTIAPSPWRPHVAAEDRLFGWDTPHGRRHRASIRLPRKLLRHLITKVLGGLAPGTRSTYGAGLLRFTQFCDRWDVSEEDRMPASYELLAAFNAEISGTVAGGTARSWMAGVRSWHVFHHAPWHGDDEWVKLTRSCVAKEGVDFEKPPRAPVSMEHLVVLRDALDISRPFDAAVWAVALVTFFGCRRLGETVVTDPSKFSPRFHVTRTALPTFQPHSALFETGPNRHRSRFPGQRRPRRKAPPLHLPNAQMASPAWRASAPLPLSSTL